MDIELPDDFPDYLRRAEEDAPIPTWEQVTRCTAGRDGETLAHLMRIVADTDDEEVARNAWLSWPPHDRRAVALIVDKITNEGWLDALGPLRGLPWDGGFFFWPRLTERGTLAEVLDGKAGAGGYTPCRLSYGLFAFINILPHGGWRKGWMENDAEMCALHVGIFADGAAEVHIDLYNPLYTNGAPRADLVRIPLIGSYNRRMYRLHRRWEMSRYAPVTRKSAVFYHLMRDTVPLCF